jgi:hypothetical protein
MLTQQEIDRLAEWHCSQWSLCKQPLGLLQCFGKLGHDWQCQREK